MSISRRQFIQFTLAGFASLPAISHAANKRVVIVGGGVAGATAAKYLRLLNDQIDVTLIEPKTDYYTCFMSNEVLSGKRRLDSIRFGYDGLRQYGVKVVHDWVTDIDPTAHKVKTKQGTTLHYDRAIVAPGIDFRWDEIEGYQAKDSEIIPHAWQAGKQTQILRNQLEAMNNGGVFIIAPPVNPFRCPPGPYERASQIAYYFKHHKPRSKIIILDAKDKFSKQKLFMQGWDKHYKGMIEWVKGSDGGAIERVNTKQMEVASAFESYKASVINMIPPQQAASIAKRSGLTDSSGWCPIHPKTFESTLQADIHVLGDATIATPLPKSGYSANSEAKVCARAIISLLSGDLPDDPIWVNTCYSLIAPNDGISVAMIYKLKDGKISKVPGAGGLTPINASPMMRAREARYAHNWFDNITHDIFF